MKASLQSTKSFGAAAAVQQVSIKGLKTMTDNRPTAIAQRKLQEVVQAKGVAQLLSRTTRKFRCNATGSKLEASIRRWGSPRGVNVQVIPTDFVGGSYKVKFTKARGSISVADANAWVRAGIAHVNDADDSESSSSESSDSE
ncbi:MAG: hypothetical protein EOO61_07230 [Hymenobacter sp.]|nr:MAG: hypothetical protein EOO61_07230 [Hymenobacter sp.]